MTRVYNVHLRLLTSRMLSIAVNVTVAPSSGEIGEILAHKSHAVGHYAYNIQYVNLIRVTGEVPVKHSVKAGLCSGVSV